MSNSEKIQFGAKVLFEEFLGRVIEWGWILGFAVFLTLLSLGSTATFLSGLGLLGLIFLCLAFTVFNDADLLIRKARAEETLAKVEGGA